MYYRLRSHCKLVKGAARGAIYDLYSGKVHSINKGAVELLEACSREAVEGIVDSDHPDDKAYIQFFDKLSEQGLGSCFFDPLPAGVKITTPQPPEIKLKFLWLELTSKCNNRCLHCYAGSGPAENSGAVGHERWLSVLAEARQAGAEAVQLIGGEPLMYPQWRELAIKAHEEGYSFIEIFTNATLITTEDIKFFKQYDIHLATTIYADHAELHDKVTQNDGSFARTMSSVEQLLAEQIPLRIASIIMKTNEQQAENIVALCTRLGVEAQPPDVIRPTGRGDDQALLPEAYHKPSIEPPFYTNEESFALASCYHTCLAGKIAVGADGNVLPCIFARSQVLGNILTASLADILSGRSLQVCWQLTKDSVETCRDCEYRYACNDCRPLAQGSDPAKHWMAASPGCSYNPYTGKWQERV